MPVLPTADVIEIAKVCEYLALQDIASRKFFVNQVIDKRLPFLLYIERKAVEFLYGYDPTDSTLDATTNYLYALCAPYSAKAQQIIGTPACTPPFILTQPVSQTANTGDNISFSVSAGGTSPLSYQWYKNGSILSGETAATLSLNNVNTGNNGTYTVQITNACGTIVSNNATLTVNAAITGYFWFGTDDPFPALNGGTDDLVYQSSFAISGNVVVNPIPSGAADGVYNVTKYPTSQGLKTTWYNTPFNNGTINDSVYRAIVTIGSFYYIIARNPMSLDVSQPLTFS